MLQLQHLILIWLLVTWIIFLNCEMPEMTWIAALTNLCVCVEHATSTTLEAARLGLARCCAQAADAYRTVRRLCSTKQCTDQSSPAAAATTNKSTTSTSGCLSSCFPKPTSPNMTCCVSHAHCVQTARQQLPRTVSEKYLDL